MEENETSRITGLGGGQQWRWRKRKETQQFCYFCRKVLDGGHRFDDKLFGEYLEEKSID